MANITVSSTSNFDDSGNSALANGDNITIDTSAVLTINSDVRWGQNAAVVGDVTITQGELKIDGSATWWVPFSSSTGNVPSLGTCGTPDVTRSGSNVGEFLGIFTALGVAPSAAGGAMPASGFIKLRTKSATLANADVLTFSGGATATLSGAGQRGWIHFVGEEGVNSSTGRVNAPRLGKITITGDWFELGTSNGTSGQTFQHFVSDYVAAVQVETGSGTGVYEWWGCAVSADFSATNVATDERGRFFTCSSAGVITFGGATYGKLPPNGARIRVPNVAISTSNSSNWAANILPGTIANRYSFMSTGGPIDAQYVCSNGAFASSGATLYQVKYSCGADGCFCDNAANSTITGANQIRFDTVAVGRIAAVNQLHFGAAYSTDIVLTDCWSFCTTGSGTNTGAFYFSNVTGCTFTRCGALNGKNINSWSVTYSSSITLTDCVFVGATSTGGMEFTGCTGVTITGLQTSSKLVDTLTAVNTTVTVTNCSNFLVDGVTLFAGTSLPSIYILSFLSQSTNIRVRNIGTRASPIQAGSAMRYIVNLANCTNVHLSKLYQNSGSQTVDAAYNMANCDEVVCSDCGDPTAYTASSVVQASAATNTAFYKRISSGGSKVYSSNAANGQTPHIITAFGTHFLEQEVSSTEAWLTINCGVEKSSSFWSTSAYTDDVGTVLRDGSNGLLLRTLNDQVTWTWNYWILGLTAFPNTAPVVNGTNTGNFTLSYDLDKGTGFSGVFKTLSAANLSAETGILATGVKIRVKAVCSTANTGNILKSISIYGTTSSSDITGNPYPYNEPPVIFTSMVSGSLAAVFRDSDGKMLDVRDSTLAKLYPAWTTNTACTVRVRKAGYDPVETGFTLTEDGANFPLAQADNAIANTDPGSLGITVTNHGASPVTWNSKAYSITVTVSDSSTAAQIAQYFSWHTARDAWNLGSSLHNMAWPPMVLAVGTSYETARGKLLGSAGAALKGVRVVDGSGNAIAGFVRFQADDGTYYTPPASVTLTGLVAGSEVRAYVGTPTSNTLLASTESSGTSFAFTQSENGNAGFIVVRKTNYVFEKISLTYGASDVSLPVSQRADRVYNNP